MKQRGDLDLNMDGDNIKTDVIEVMNFIVEEIKLAQDRL